MTTFLSKSREERKVITDTIVQGAWLLCYHTPLEWGVVKAGEILITRGGDRVILVDDECEQAGGDITEHNWSGSGYEASGPVVHPYQVIKVLTDKDEAEAVAKSIFDLMAIYKEEMMAPQLKMEMGVAMVLG